jgi:hypothetical protein
MWHDDDSALKIRNMEMAIRNKTVRRSTRIGASSPSQQLADPKLQKRLNRALAKWENRTRHLVDAVRSSEHLSEKDFAIRINTKG